jgi:uncharacterized pyridoxamine 5'-phosphate oxidase family protein
VKIAEAIREFHEAAKIAFLATCEGDRPRVRPMSPVLVEGDVVWMAAGASSDKMSQIAADPHAELCYMKADHSHLRLRGTIEVCDDPSEKKRMWDAYPMLREHFSSADDPEYTLLKLTVSEGKRMPSMSYSYERLEP